MFNFFTFDCVEVDSIELLLSLNIYRLIILSLGNAGLVSQWPVESLVEALFEELVPGV
jgi:hypothetical protein